MGNCCLPSRFRRTSSAARPKNITLLLLGLDNAGKTTIAKRLAGEPVDSVVPTVGFSVILLREKGSHVSIYDLGGGPQIRDIWPRYYADAHGVIFVTDATDLNKLNECREVLQNLLSDSRVSGKPVLLLANKQDLEGALDEIDVVERLNLEPLVNEQKCPTLVELCSALNFSKKLDIGIDNGYKWLIRSIVRDYPNLNGRVLSDLAKQEEENKVHFIKRNIGDGDGIKNSNSTERSTCITSFKPVAKVLEGQGYANGINVPRKKIKMGVKAVTNIPGFVEEVSENSKIGKTQTHRLSEEIGSFTESDAKSIGFSYSSEFFAVERFQSDAELLNNISNHSFTSFLIRPKSSGARLYGVSSERKRRHRRRPLRKLNKTGPSPFTDISNEYNHRISRNQRKKPEKAVGQRLETKNSIENVNPFLANGQSDGEQRSEVYDMTVFRGSKSVPNSRRNSTSFSGKRRQLHVNRKLLQTKGFSSLDADGCLPSGKEIILDVTKLVD